MVADVHGATQLQSETHAPCDVSGHGETRPLPARIYPPLAWCAEGGHAEGRSASSRVLCVKPRPPPVPLECSRSRRLRHISSVGAESKKTHPLVQGLSPFRSHLRLRPPRSYEHVVRDSHTRSQVVQYTFVAFACRADRELASWDGEVGGIEREKRRERGEIEK